MQDFSNNSAGLLSVGINTAATSIVLTDASSFPTPAGGSYFFATLIGLNANGQEATWEIVKCTARAGNTLTVLRAQEGTVAAVWGVATRIEMRLTAGFATVMDDHIDNTDNPHGVTKNQVGLGSVDNTTDAAKPVSTAQQVALNTKANFDSPIRLNPRNIAASTTITSAYNAASVGPITISDGVIVTISDNATWSIH